MSILTNFHIISAFRAHVHFNHFVLPRVVGSNRLPAFSDFQELTYMRAIVKETMRWRPVSSGGFAHKLTEDLEYKGWVLPKGASVVANHW